MKQLLVLAAAVLAVTVPATATYSQAQQCFPSGVGGNYVGGAAVLCVVNDVAVPFSPGQPLPTAPVNRYRQ